MLIGLAIPPSVSQWEEVDASEGLVLSSVTRAERWQVRSVQVGHGGCLASMSANSTHFLQAIWHVDLLDQHSESVSKLGKSIEVAPGVVDVA